MGREYLSRSASLTKCPVTRAKRRPNPPGSPRAETKTTVSHELHANDHMFSRGETPWHGLGTVLTAETNLTSAQALATAKLDWTVSLAALQTVPNGHDAQPVDCAKAVRRDDSGAVLGVVGNGFRPLQNAQAFQAFDAWSEAGLISYETAGSLRGGGRIWILARLGTSDLEIGSGDKIAPYVLLAHGHDGSLAVRVKATAVRVVCANTLAMSLGDSLPGIRITHRGDIATKAAQAVAAVDGVRVAAERQAAKWRAMAATPADGLDVARYLAAVYERPLDEIMGNGTDAKGAPRKQIRSLDPIGDLFDSPRGGQLATTEGTVWGLYQAVTAYLTHGGDGSQRDAGARLDSVAFGTAAGQIDRAELVADVLASVGIHKSSGITWDDLIGASTSELAGMVASKRAA